NTPLSRITPKTQPSSTAEIFTPGYSIHLRHNTSSPRYYGCKTSVATRDGLKPSILSSRMRLLRDQLSPRKKGQSKLNIPHQSPPPIRGHGSTLLSSNRLGQQLTKHPWTTPNTAVRNHIDAARRPGECLNR
ncbi:hypothetical protein L249_5006, partial [Ophiocordyceps polyrhachis-furcata BCC 54312]